MIYCSESQRAGVYQKRAVKLLLFPINTNLTPEFDSSVISVQITEVQIQIHHSVKWKYYASTVLILLDVFALLQKKKKKQFKGVFIKSIPLRDISQWGILLKRINKY